MIQSKGKCCSRQPARMRHVPTREIEREENITTIIAVIERGIAKRINRGVTKTGLRMIVPTSAVTIPDAVDSRHLRAPHVRLVLPRNHRSSERRWSDTRDRRHRSRSRSPFRQDNARQNLRKMQSWHEPRRPRRSRSRSPANRNNRQGEDDRLARLAEMQQNASKLDGDRSKRNAAAAAREREDAEKDERVRADNARYGDRARFVNGLQKKAGELDLGERLGRSRAGMERQQEAY